MQITPSIISTNESYIALGANVSMVVNAINSGAIIPYGDFGGANVYWFQTMKNGMGNLIFTIFDRNTTLGLASYMVRYGAAATIQQVVFQPYPSSQIELQYIILPYFPSKLAENGTVI